MFAHAIAKTSTVIASLHVVPLLLHYNAQFNKMVVIFDQYFSSLHENFFMVDK